MNLEPMIADQGPDGLHIHIAFEYLTADELATLLLASHFMYETLFWAPLPAMLGTPHTRAQSLQVRYASTGNSIDINLVNEVGRAVGGLDPRLTGVGGGIVVVALAAKVMIQAFKSGHEALSAARLRNLQVTERQIKIDGQRANAALDARQGALQLQVSASDVELRTFTSSILRSAISDDFARSLDLDLSLTDSISAALRSAWSVIEHENIREVSINGESVKSDE